MRDESHLVLASPFVVMICVVDFFGGTGFANFATHSEFSATLVTGAILPVRKCVLTEEL